MNSLSQRPAVLYIIDGLEFGGGERVFLQLIEAFKNRFRVFAATHPQGQFAQEIRNLDVHLCKIDMNRQFSLRPVIQLKEFVKKNKIAILHSQGARADFFARLAGRLFAKTNIVCTVAMPVEGFDVSYLRKRIYRFIDYLTERQVARFLVVSESLRQALIEKRNMQTQKVVRIYNGIELEKYSCEVVGAHIREKYQIGHDVPLVGAIGRMVWQKGFKYLIRAIPEIVSKKPRIKILLVGDGPQENALKKEAKRLGVLESIIFTGFQPEVKEILAGIDLLVVPSILEGFPMIILEGMAMGKPIIATNINGINEQIVSGESGILIPPGDPDSISSAVIRIIDDKAGAGKIGTAARARVEQEYSVEKMIWEHEKVYCSLLKENLD